MLQVKIRKINTTTEHSDVSPATQSHVHVYTYTYTHADTHAQQLLTAEMRKKYKNT